MAYYIGLMSGTSMDAIDAALVDFSDNKCTLITSHSHEIPARLITQLQTLIQHETFNIKTLGTLDVELGELFADTAKQLLCNAQTETNEIVAIGSHGQTVFHAPDSTPPFTLQIGDPNTIAQYTGITTVADFRRRDIAAGGQGAPLAPAFHNNVFRSCEKNRIILNIGGIANITALSADNSQPVLGFDTGPGNCLLDSWIAQHLNQRFDEDGAWGAAGTINSELLEILLQDDYFSLAAPKTTGREYFNLHWLNQHKLDDEPRNIQATLAQLTIESISRAIENHTPNADEVYVCGGGAFNQLLMQSLNKRLSNKKLATTTELGITPEWVEAAAFAWLAKQTMENHTGNISSVTGANESVILGGIYPGKYRTK